MGIKGVYHISEVNFIIVPKLDEIGVRKIIAQIEGNKDIEFYLPSNLPAHKTRAAMETYERLGIKIIWSPIYSPQYSSVEYYWNTLKKYVRQMRLQDILEKKQASYEKYIKKAMGMITVENVNSYFRHTYSLLDINQ